MAPTLAATRSSNKQDRFADYDLRESDAASTALQRVSDTSPPAWEEFRESDEDDSADEGSNDAGAETVVGAKKKDKVMLPKDAEEEELERLIFGDSAGFKEGIDSFTLAPVPGAIDREPSGDTDSENEFANLADHDLFIFDSGPTAAASESRAIATVDESEDDADRPAWEDSDDEQLVVSLVSRPQLRKLRETAEDDMISGKEYSRRLQKLYERLHPTPNWAVHATGKAKRKRRHTVEQDESDGDSASEMDVDEANLSTLPLARLLKDADILSRNSQNPAKRRKLQAGKIDIQRLPDIAKAGPSAITSISFHPTYPLLLSSGPSATLSLHHVNPDPLNPNPLLTSLHVKGTPLTMTAFHPSPSDSRIFLSARRRFFHVWNLASGTVEKVTRVYGHQHEQRTMEEFSLSPNGKYMALRGSSKKGGGVVNILDARTLQWAAQARIESRGGVADFSWWGDGNGLSIAGKNGEVTEWSVEEGVVGRWTDDGAVGTTVIAVGGRSGRDGWLGGDRWVAMGSSSGVVNVYDRRSWVANAVSRNDTAMDDNGGIPKAPKPLRVLDQLTTPVSHLAFSPDGQIMVMASRWKQNALRLVHLPSATVFQNWPAQKTPLGRISSVAWGRPTEEDEKEGSLALLAVGSETGRVKLWEVRA